MPRTTNFFNKIPLDAFENLGIGAGILLSEFNPASPSADDENILCASTGGFSFSDVPTFKDMAEDIDNAPKNMKEYMEVDSRTVSLSGTAVSISSDFLRRVMITTTSGEALTPAHRLDQTMFRDVWWVGEYGTNNGFIAIHLKNALCTSGLSLAVEDNGKAKVSFTLTAHYSAAAQETVPYEIYLTQGDAASGT